MASKKKNSVLGTILLAPVLIIGSILALWENEDRFDYHKAAQETLPVQTPAQGAANKTISFTGQLDTSIPITGEYGERFNGFHIVERRAEIYSWEETEDDDKTTWTLDWYSEVEDNSRNQRLRQRLSDATLYAPKYLIGGLDIAPERIHFVDDWIPITPEGLELSETGHRLGLARSGDYLYARQVPGIDTLGDERVSYNGITNAPTATYFGELAGGRAVGRQFEVHEGIISRIIRNDGILHHLVNGLREDALFKIGEDFVRKRWMVRIGGTIAIILALFMLFDAFAGALYRIPYFGRLVSAGVFLASLLLGLGIALFVILSGIILHNPLAVALPGFLVLGGVIYLVQRSRVAKANAEKTLEQRLATNRTAGAAAVPSPAGIAATPAAAISVTGNQVRDSAAAAADTITIEQTFINLSMLALAEGGLHRKEYRYLAEWGKRNGVTSERMEQLFAAARKPLNPGHPANREDLELLVCMAMADGVLSKQEWSMLMGFGSRIGLAETEVRSMIRDVESGAAVSG